MPTRPRLVKYINYAYNPQEVKEDYRVSCSVCGFNGIDPIRTAEPEVAPFSLVITGTVYQPEPGQSLDVIDKEVTREIPAFSACPFCGSPDWAFGQAPDLKW